MTTRHAGLRWQRILGVTLAAAVAAVVAFTLLVPPEALLLREPDWRPAGTAWRGAFHVHTNRSDGTGTIDEVAAAAARAGLQFVVLTDHGDGTRPPEAPSYRSGVLVIDGVEISTTAGHYAAIGLPRAPYPLGGEARDVVEDVARLGGFGVIAHPDSPKSGQTWRDWSAPVNAIEWLNADSQWRDEGTLRLALAALAYPFRPAETLASLLNRPDALGAWDRAAASRPVVALAGADAHARIGLRADRDPYQGRTMLAVPSYESSFRAFSLHLVTAAPPSGRAEDDARSVMQSLREGRVHTVIDGWATPALFEFAARAGGLDVYEGGELTTGEPTVLRARSNAPLFAATVLLRDGVEVQRVDRQSLVYATDRPGRYRVEVWLGRPGSRTPIPWLVSNAIVLRSAAGEASGDPEGGQAANLKTRDVQPDWHLEHEARSTGAIDPDGQADEGVVMRYRLARGRPAGQFAALVTPIRLGGPDAAILFRARAAAPMRLSVQLRAPGGGRRWRRSIYLDSTLRAVRVPVADMRPAEPGMPPGPPPVGLVDNLLFVVDTVNTAPGSEGHFAVSQVRVESDLEIRR